MTPQELKRLVQLEKKVKEYAQEWGLLTTDINFEVVTAQRMFEGLSYNFPMNFSHWSFGRDYDRQRTIYERTGEGIPYEVVWNFDKPRAFLVETNPFALNVVILGHVFGHVDFFLGSRYLQHGRESFGDVAEDAQRAADRFLQYEIKYGAEEVEKMIDSAFSIQWHQNPDPFFQELPEEVVRESLMTRERELLEADVRKNADLYHVNDQEITQVINEILKDIEIRTPPLPVHDLLWYFMNKSPKPLKPWMKDVLTVIRNQARCLAPQRLTKMLNEGWATYWHTKMMIRLFEEGFLTAEEHHEFNGFNSGVLRPYPKSINPYRIGVALFEYVKERGDKGQFGTEYENCQDPHKKANWDTKAGQGDRLIFEIRSGFTDAMAVRHYFTPEFIESQNFYSFSEIVSKYKQESVAVIEERDVDIIRKMLIEIYSSSGIPKIVVRDGDYKGQGHLLLEHIFEGYELDAIYRDLTMQNIFHIWGRTIYLHAQEDDRLRVFSFGQRGKHEVKDL